MEIIPAIDLMNGQCVRLSQGDFDRQTVYSNDPVETAKRFEAAGFRRLHLVDLDGAKAGETRHLKTLEAICRATKLSVDFSGGVSSTPILQSVFDAGAELVVVGSLAARNPELFGEWREQFGNQRFILGADSRGGKVAVSGWLETTELDLIDYVKSYVAEGVTNVMCTAIERDGAGTGPDFELYAELLSPPAPPLSGGETIAPLALTANVSPPDKGGPGGDKLSLIASGGVSSLEQVERLAELGLSGCIIGKALYEGKISATDLTRFLC